jgi:hypothetical protein
MLTLGIDPDSKDLALATWDDNGPRDARVIHVVGKSTNYEMLTAIAEHDLLWCGRPDRTAIEGQQVDGRKTKEGTLFKLAHMTGAIALRVRQVYRSTELHVPTPKVWKGQLPKHAQQARLYDDLGWGYTIKGSIEKKTAYAVPVTPPSHLAAITPAQWNHVGDAFLLARWAYNR